MTCFLRKTVFTLLFCLPRLPNCGLLPDFSVKVRHWCVFQRFYPLFFQETHVFKFAQKTITRFICQIRICLQSDECKKLSVGLTEIANFRFFPLPSVVSAIFTAVFPLFGHKGPNSSSRFLVQPPSTCPTLEERLQQAKVERDAQQEDVKQLMKPEESGHFLSFAL